MPESADSHVSTSDEFELRNFNRRALSAYYTTPNVAALLLGPQLARWRNATASSRRQVVLEPTCGTGNIAVALLASAPRPDIEIILCDVDSAALKIAVAACRNQSRPGDRVRHYAGDPSGISRSELGPVDYIVGNPPFGRHVATSIVSKSGAKDASVKFMEWALSFNSAISFVMPKVVLINDDAADMRCRNGHRLHSVDDFGETAFKDVKVETIGLHFGDGRGRAEMVHIESQVLGTSRVLPRSSLTHGPEQHWLLYRNELFDAVLDLTDEHSWGFYRDRRIGRAMRNESGTGEPVIRASNIRTDGTIGEPNVFLSGDLSSMPLRGGRGLLVPNLSYYPRGGFYERSLGIPDGSAPFLIDTEDAFSRSELIRIGKFYASDWFFAYYRVARNFSRRSLNVDRATLKYWRVPGRRTPSALWRRSGVAIPQNVMRTAGEYIKIADIA